MGTVDDYKDFDCSAGYRDFDPPVDTAADHRGFDCSVDMDYYCHYTDSAHLADMDSDCADHPMIVNPVIAHREVDFPAIDCTMIVH